MEMSPKAIAAVTFPVVRKGYDPEQVRSFLSQLSRGVEELQNRALQAEAKSRLSAAPAPAAEPAPNMDSITKTLVMAQRTADATLGRRSALSDDVDALSGHVTTQREQLASTVLVLNQALEHPGLQDVPKPTLSAPPADPPGPALVPPSEPDAGPPTELMGTAEPEAPRQPDQPAEADRGFPAPQAAAGTPDPITQEVPLVEQGEPQAWSFFDEGPKGDDRWKK